MSQCVRSKQNGPVTTVSIDTPKYRNSMGAPGVREALVEAIETFENDDIQRVLVLTGANGVFSAGGNLKALSKLQSRSEFEQRLVAGGNVIETILRSSKLYVAAVEGPAFGAGVGLATACDIVVAAKGARFCAAQIKVGASPDGGMFWSVPLRMGRAGAKRFLLTGEEIEDAIALSSGLADYLVERGAALEKAQELAAKLAVGPPRAQATIKQFFAQYITGKDAVLDWEREQAVDNFLTQDFAEGTSAFFLKRSPKFRGK